ncbi:MAG: hypothetical protein KI793_31075 [Rivularia sp. (in: Bacteria)]|nr:hypothetical protein [Rivularia sp. MS3]
MLLTNRYLLVDKIEQSVRYSKSKGVEVENIKIDEITGKRFTFFKDSDDFPLEIYEF